MSKQSTRSAQYQYKFTEVYVEPDFLYSFAQQEAVKFTDAVRDADLELREVFLNLLQKHLTKRQWEVFRGLSAGATQQDLAKQLGVNQSSITKALFGNVNYDESIGERGKKYGGVIRKVPTILKVEGPALAPYMEKVEKALGSAEDLPLMYALIKSAL